jgi:rubredoxin
MIHQSGISARKLVWVEGRGAEWQGCSECSWVFSPSCPPVGDSLEAMKWNFQTVSDEFASHDCARHTSRGESARKREMGCLYPTKSLALL